MAQIKNGKLKALAITGKSRSSALPQVPTFAEAGLPLYDQNDSWQGIVAPAGTPRDIIDNLSTEVGRIVAMPVIQEYMAKQGSELCLGYATQLSTNERYPNCD